MREEKLDRFYAQLRDLANASATESNSRLLIFPSTSDVDSLCALKVIVHVLDQDNITPAVYPVSSFQGIYSYVSEDYFSGQVTVLLINWGGHRDLRRVLKLGDLARVFVVDCHRPIHLHNLSEENERVVVLYTREDEMQADCCFTHDFEGEFDVSALANACDLDSDDELDEESDSDSESEDEEEGGKRKRRKVSQDGEEDDNDPVRLFGKLKKKYYKMGTFHGKPSGCLMFDLAHLLVKSTKELLWFSCVSLIDQFVHERLTDERYQAGVMELEQHINSSLNLGDPPEWVTLQGGVKVRSPDCDRVAYEDEPRLMLLQEWNLFDSMLCSPYIATKLKTWSDNGIKKLKLLLARMGFSLVDCQQKFQCMNIEVKRKMRDEFDRFLPEYGLSEFYYRSFMRLQGHRPTISAADVVYGVTALLESSVNSDGSCSSAKFNLALNALSKLDTLRSGMQQAIKVQRAIVRQSSMAITKSGCIRSGRKFRWVKLEDSADSRLLGYPQALTNFCYFLMDALREKGARMKPLLCACLAQEPNKVLIVGVCGKPRLGAIQGNTFGSAFKNAAKEIGAEYSQDLFESSWIVLNTRSINSFMVKLTEQL